MITLDLLPGDLANLRFGYSPLIEVSNSYRALRYRPEELSLHRTWEREAREALRDVHLPYMDALILPKHYIADFITPTPTETVRTFEDALDTLRKTPEQVIITNVNTVLEMTDITPARQHFLEDPCGALMQLEREVITYWERALASHWGRMVGVLENDVLYRARQLALFGAECVFAEIGQKLRYMPGLLMIDKEYCITQAKKNRMPLGGEGLQLVPAIFGGNCSVMTQFEPEYRPMIIYTARGGGLWHHAPTPTNEALETLIGAGKTRVLQALIDPQNTTELAHQLSLTPGAVSQHLGHLSQSGLVESHRSGSRVYYRLSLRGEQLLGLFG